MQGETFIKFICYFYIVVGLCEGGPFEMSEEGGSNENNFPSRGYEKRSFFSLKNNKDKEHPTPFLKCDFIGHLAIRYDCEHYLSCTQIGKIAGAHRCPTGLKFNMKTRLCTGASVECDNSKICPNAQTRYVEENLNYRNDYLQCKNGVPYPQSCRDKGMEYHGHEQTCMERHE